MEPFAGEFMEAPPAFGDARRTPFSVSSMLLRAKWWIFGVFAFISGVTVPWMWVLVHPTYRASAIVQVSASVPRIVFRTEDNAVLPLYQSYLNTQVAKIRSPRVLKRVLENPEVQRTRWHTDPPRTLMTVLGGNAPSPFERLRENLSVAPRRNTELIDVSMAVLDPADAKVIVDTVVDEYQKLSAEERTEYEKLVFDRLRSERAALQKEIDGLVELKGNLSKRLGTGDPDIVRSQLAMQYSALRAQRETLDREHKMTLWELDSLGAPSASQDGSQDAGEQQSASSAPKARYDSDPEWRLLNRQLEGARHELGLARQQYGEWHPQIQQRLANVDHAEELLGERKAQLEYQWAQGLIPTSDAGATFANRPVELERLSDRQEQELNLLDGQIQELQSELEAKGELAKDFAKYDEQLQNKRELYKAVHDRLTTLQMEEKAPGRISVANHAVAPSRPDSDRRILLTVMALGVAMMAGLAAGYLRVSMDTKIREASDVQFAIRVPFLGQLPPLPTTQDLMGGCSPLLMESVRMVRTAFLERLTGTGKNVVVITSSTSRAGKTSVAILLARSLALLGKKTLLVEGDLRRPSLAGRINIDARTGLVAVLRGAATDAEAIVSTGVNRFDVLVAGEQIVEFDSELLANGVLTACLERWRAIYDYILVDSPPVLPVADARILASQADGTVMVLRSAHCRRTELVQAYADLCGAGGTLLGTVLIGGRHAGKYGYGYGYGNYADPSRSLKA
jgi:capsular exopolysaccharide synthesis family protein